ncbi:MAG: NAD(P)/FAD-dependent oxidoreductase [Candidatus Omnitrophota bacterium]
MTYSAKEQYDVVIIGSGVAGLVCGCYLAKKGLSILIIEKHNKVGGYCTSFTRMGYSFDVAVHYLGSLRPGGVLNKILSDISLENEIVFNRIDPCDKIIMPDHVVLVRNNTNGTRESFKQAFFHESANIDKFFDFMIKEDFQTIYLKTVKRTFTELLDSFFRDSRLKSTISVLLGNIGLPPSRVSALTASILFREYVFDPGYYPSGGMQCFSNALLKRFTGYGGEVLLSKEVKKIETENRKIKGVALDNGGYIFSNMVISNADALLTLGKMLDCGYTGGFDALERMEISQSAFVCYFGVDSKIEKAISPKCTTWYFNTYDMETCYGKPITPACEKLNYAVITYPSAHSGNLGSIDKSTVQILMGAKYDDERNWSSVKHMISRKIIAFVADIIPDINRFIKYTTIATPYDFYRYTYNHAGAMYGWAALQNQIKQSILAHATPIENLFLVGHWVTNGFGQSGIPAVALSGKNVAKIVLSKLKTK